MSAHTRRFIACDHPQCAKIFWGSFSWEGIKDVRVLARQREGWAHPSGYVDYCPEHK